MSNAELSRTDFLAMERTKLANERTFLAYFRTFIVFLSSGVAIVKLDILSDISFVGYLLIILSPIMFAIGLVRYLLTKSRLKKYYS